MRQPATRQRAALPTERKPGRLDLATAPFSIHMTPFDLTATKRHSPYCGGTGRRVDLEKCCAPVGCPKGVRDHRVFAGAVTSSCSPIRIKAAVLRFTRRKCGPVSRPTHIR